MGRFIEGTDRGQNTLFPECLEDWIGEDNPVRVIDAFVEELDLAELRFGGVDPEATGRPSYHPSLLLKLYIYGYLNRVQSSRRLEREAGRNVEVMWLVGRLVPDHKTIADFRKDNGPAIRKVCAQFVALCREIGLLTNASVAIDGSKFKAVNNRDKNFTRAKMERRLAQIEESVARYLSQLDTADLQEPSEALAAKTAHLKEKLAKLASELQRLKAIEKEMLASPDQQISLTDPDFTFDGDKRAWLRRRRLRRAGRCGYGASSDRHARGDEYRHGSVTTCEDRIAGQGRSSCRSSRCRCRSRLLQQHRDFGMRAGRYYGDAAKADDIGREVGWSLRQAGLRLSADGGCLSLSCRREANLSLYERGGRQDAAPLLDDGVPTLPAQVSVYDGTPATHYAMGTRARAGSRATASR